MFDAAALDASRLDQVHDRMLRVARTDLTQAAFKVAVLQASEREKHQLSAQVWGPRYTTIRQGAERWMTSYQQLRRMPPGNWGNMGATLIQSGDNLINAIVELNRNVTNADWTRTLTFLNIGVKAAASIPTIVREGAKIAVNVVADVGQAAGQGVARTLAPIKTYLFLAAGVAALFYLGPLIKGFGSKLQSRKASP